MKRLLWILLLVLLLAGCSLKSGKETAVFYYPRSNYVYGADSGVIAGEERDITGHREEWSFLLSLYLVGPTDKNLTAPLPRGTQVLESYVEGDTVYLTVSDTKLSDSRLLLACSCLAKTFHGLSEQLRAVSLTSGSKTQTVCVDSMVVTDSAR